MVLFIGVFLALNQPIPSAGKPFQEPQKRSANTGQQSHNQEKPTQPSVPPVAPILQPDAAPQAQEKPAEVPNSKNPETSNERVAWFTGILAVVAVLQLVTLIWQILTARSTARKELQAYVLPVGASRYTENGVPKLKVVLRNSGKTPALNCVSGIFRGIAPTVKPLPPLPDLSEFKSLRSDSFIASGQDIWMLDEDTLSPEEVRDIRSGVRAIYAVGSISYRDVFKTKHTSRYRFMCSGKNLDSGTFVFCDEGNSID